MRLEGKVALVTGGAATRSRAGLSRIESAVAVAT
jgi:hypothetical protein